MSATVKTCLVSMCATAHIYNLVSMCATAHIYRDMTFITQYLLEMYYYAVKYNFFCSNLQSLSLMNVLHRAETTERATEYSLKQLY